jgi:V8-like Glu-specific endopeptidase
MEAMSAATKTARKLTSGNYQSGLESVQPELPPREQLNDRVEAFLARLDPGESRMTESLRTRVDWALRTLYDGETPPEDANVSTGFEAVVIADGSRPVFFVTNDRLELGGVGEGPFVDIVRGNIRSLELAALSVGRIETDDKLPPAGMDKWYDGTAFLVADNLAMTNRHVVERLVNEPSSESGPFTLKARYWLNFGAEAGSQPARRFKIERVVFAGAQVIGKTGDLARLDMALLRVGDSEVKGTVRPQPLPLSLEPVMTFQPIAVIGYPAAPRVFTGVGAPPVDYELEEILRRVFDNRFGFKRCASGEIDDALGLTEDLRGWILQHDASTLSGNSGSPVMLIGNSPLKVAALHFRGIPREANYAHIFGKIATELRNVGVSLP